MALTRPITRDWARWKMKNTPIPKAATTTRVKSNTLIARAWPGRRPASLTIRSRLAHVSILTRTERR